MQNGNLQVPVSSVFIGYDTKHVFEIINGPVYHHVITLLTGMPMEKINEVGGFEVLDPNTNQTIFDSICQHV